MPYQLLFLMHSSGMIFYSFPWNLLLWLPCSRSVIFKLLPFFFLLILIWLFEAWPWTLKIHICIFPQLHAEFNLDFYQQKDFSLGGFVASAPLATGGKRWFMSKQVWRLKNNLLPWHWGWAMSYLMYWSFHWKAFFEMYQQSWTAGVSEG